MNRIISSLDRRALHRGTRQSYSRARRVGETLPVMKPATTETEYVVKNGKRTAVILPNDEYEELLQDLDDLAVIARRKNEPTIPLAEEKHNKGWH